MSVLRAEDLAVHYRGVPALRGVGAEVRRHGVTALVGPSGCGKPSLLNCLTRMCDLVPGCRVTGRVELDGEDVLAMTDVVALRRRVGMIFQKPNPFAKSIRENIKKHQEATVQDLYGKVITEVTRFGAGQPQHDDITLVVLRRNGSA